MRSVADPVSSKAPCELVWIDAVQPVPAPVPVIKRFFDIFCAVLLLFAALPVLVCIAIAIWMESGGPVLFGHLRVGRGNRHFRLWKFRTMVLDAEETLRRHLRANPALAHEWARTHKLKKDPRVTRMGRFLRRTSLDELPQLVNVLRGDMSMVGPRPIVQEEIGKYGRGFILYQQVRPGLTGLWQVSGRNDTNYRRRVELDCEYIRCWSLGQDVVLLLKTVPVVLVGKGAY
jgi:Undecaprenyl-phosphate galactose phosphotransferase WbaP